MDVVQSFRPLDGESFSKPYDGYLMFTVLSDESFRPLDGESFSKLDQS